MTEPLADESSRRLARSALAESVFLSAGAGTGKSTTLVERILATLVDDGREVRIGEIVAITFTEKAGAELKHRLRTALTKECAQADADSRHRRALAEIETAQVGTIHSFAQRILRRFALEARLPLGFAVVADVESTQARRQRAREVVASAREFKDIDAVLRMYQVRLKNLLEMIEALDTLALRISPSALDASKATHFATYRERAMTSISRFMMRFETDCINEDDLLYVRLQEKSQSLLNFLGSADVAQLAELHVLRNGKGIEQFKLSGGSSKYYRVQEPKYWRDEWKALAPDVYAALMAPLETSMRQLLEHAGTQLAEAREGRRASGEIEFDDLLSMADELLEHDPAVRARLHAEIKVMLIDEFQDTDPIQWNLIQRLTAAPNDNLLRPLPGHLVVVGDPKQAIYSFRGADIRTFRSAQHRFAAGERPLGPILELSSNFRTVEPIIDWVNDVFERAMNSPTQVEYRKLVPVHALQHAAAGPAVTILRDPVVEAGDETRNPKLIEAELVANSIRRVVGERWHITRSAEQRSRVYDRPASYKDIAVLFPTRSSLDILLNALDSAGIPYRSSDAALVFDRAVVLGAIQGLTAVADPSNELAVWLTLKTPLFGCTDADLVDFRNRGGRWSGFVDEELRSTPAGRAIHQLNELRQRFGGEQPVHIMNELFRVTRIFEVLALAPRGAFDADCLRMLRTHAQQWQDQGGIGLIEYVETVEEMRTEFSRAQFPAPDDQDDDAVQLMTIFAAKGLEFPVVLLTGMTTRPRALRPSIGIVNRDRIEFSLNKAAESIEYADWFTNVHKVADNEERMRVLYVACTRAMDHLIVSICGESSRHTSGSAGALLRPFVPVKESDVREPVPVEYGVVETAGEPAAPIESDWLPRLEAVRERSNTPFVALPSGTAALALGLAATGQDADSLPEPLTDESSARMSLAARDGAAFGQCLHAVMDQVVSGRIDGSEESLLSAATEALAAVDTNLDIHEIADSARTAIGSPVVQAALQAERKWSELYLATTTRTADVALVEGIADLVFEDTNGDIVVVDYKTDRTLSDQSKTHYREQLACYAELLQRVTGKPVARRVVVHVPAGKATEYEF